MSDRYSEVIGRSVHRIGALERLTGEARFAADIEMEGCVTVMALRSDRPHAHVVTVDALEALAMPGCLGVFTARDIPGQNRFGIIVRDQQLLADDKVR